MDDIPFFGFRDSRSYNVVLQNNPVLFRLHADASPTHHGINGPIVAPRYANFSVADLPSLPLVRQSTYGEVARHLNVYKNLEKRNSVDFQTPWVSTTFNFPYLMWEASRRIMYRYVKEQELYVLMIDGRHRSVRERAVTAVDLLDRLGGDHNADEWRFANACQEVLVHGYINSDAIICIMPWTELRLLIQEEYLQHNFLVIAEVEAHEISPFESYSWHLAVELRKRYSRYELMKSSLALATHLLGNKLGSLTEDPADVIDILVAATRAVGFWIERSGGPLGDVSPEVIADNSNPSQVFRTRVVDLAIGLPAYKRWSQLVRLELRMEQIKQRYIAYKQMVRHDEPTDSRPQRLRDALQYFAAEMPST
ncbi:hypothetical protein NM688_g3415 [Phlebia brevispora]|uniref:Uncharacterized protein n=1 Tax=Phlebia brevispora TaxID=194682 RepID=A0ACC1T674_9APHY|nr:hypothetical protein NM688_g3415 [Phlebia brevispora]